MYRDFIIFFTYILISHGQHVLIIKKKQHLPDLKPKLLLLKRNLKLNLINYVYLFYKEHKHKQGVLSVYIKISVLSYG